MAELIQRHWDSNPAGLSRRDRRPCDYDAYVPDPIAGRRFVLDGDVAADVADAETAIARLNSQASALADTEALARLLLRAESVASSRIEGLEIAGRRLLRAAVARELGDEVRDVTAIEILGNIAAMVWAIGATQDAGNISPDFILEIHRRLLAETQHGEHAGRIRTEQNWIGGSSYNPCSAAFVPPPPETVADLLVDLCEFCNETSLPAVAQAAIAHAQFETIHPFADGNGRTGRALIHLILAQRDLTPRTLPPVSLVLATWSEDYIAGLSATRYVGEADCESARDGVNQWVGLFAAACTRAVGDANAFEYRMRSLRDQWRARLGKVRAGSAADLLIGALPVAPIVTTKTAADLIGRSFQATSQAIARLRAAGILKQLTVGKRNRAFEAAEVIEAFTDLERQLASPAGDTSVARPRRPVPRRPRR